MNSGDTESEENLEQYKERIPFKIGLNYAFGQFASGILQGLVFSNLTFFYIEKFAADPELIGLAWMIFLVWNTVNDPIISYFIDNTRTKLGRRIPYIRYGSIFYGLAFIFSWFPIASPGDQLGLFFNFILALFLLDTIFTIVGCCFFCLPNEIAITAEGRATLSVYQSFATVGVVIGTFGIPILLLTGHVGIPAIFSTIILLIGLGCSLLLFISSFFLKEHLFSQLQPHEPFLEGLKLTFKNKAFWFLMPSAFVSSIVLPILATGLLYYIEYVIAGQTYDFIIVGIGLGLISGLIANLYLIEKIRPKKTSILDSFCVAIGFLLLFVARQNAMLAAFPAFPLGFGFAGIMIVSPVLMGDVIDNYEMITGKRREAIYGGVNAIVTKPGLSIANWMFTNLIVTFGFVKPIIVNGVAQRQSQTSLAITGILIAFCIIPGIGLMIGGLTMFWYPLDGPEWRKKKRELMEIHKQKEQEYIKQIRKNPDFKPLT